MTDVIFIIIGVLIIIGALYSIYTLIRGRFIKYKPLDPEIWERTTARITGKTSYSKRVVPAYKAGKTTEDMIVHVSVAEFEVDGKTYSVEVDEVDRSTIELYYKKKHPQHTTTEEKHKQAYLTIKHRSAAPGAVVGTVIAIIALLAIGWVLISSGISELTK